MKLRVYIAGPYTKGDVALNVRRAIEAGDAVYKAGHMPFIPHLTHFWHLVCPAPYEQWIAMDLDWLEACDVVIRLPGESSGADGEARRARELDMCVYQGLDEFLDFCKRSTTA